MTETQAEYIRRIFANAAASIAAFAKVLQDIKRQGKPLDNPDPRQIALF
jgi:hypothetical protein